MNKMIQCAKLIVPAVLAVCFAAPVSAATCTSIASGNWNAKSTWGTALLGCVNLTGGIPGTADTVVIAGNTTVTILAAAAANSVTVGNASSNKLSSLTFNAANSSLTVGTDVTISAPTSNTSGRDRQILVNAGTLTVARNVILNGSTQNNTYARLTLTTGTASISGGLTVNSSTTAGRAVVTVGTGTINVNGSAGVANGDTIAVGAGTFNMNNTAATFSNSNATIVAATSISTGTLSVAGNLTNAAGETITVSSTGNINAGGNWNNNGTFTAGTGTVTFNGAAAQNLGGIAATIFNNLTISKTTGDVTITSASALFSPTVNGILALTNGHVFTTVGTNDLGSGPLGTVSAAPAPSNASHVVGDMQKNFPNGASSFTFPIGDGINYQPVTVALTGATAGTLNAHVDSGDHPDTIANLSGIDQTKSANHYWTLTPGTLAGGTYTATFQFCVTTTCNVPAERDTLVPNPPANFIVARKYPVATGSWIRPTVSTITANTILTTGGGTSATGFGVFAVGAPLVGVYKGVNQLIDLREVY